jgi:hypothetical protein
MELTGITDECTTMAATTGTVGLKNLISLLAKRIPALPIENSYAFFQPLYLHQQQHGH